MNVKIKWAVLFITDVIDDRDKVLESRKHMGGPEQLELFSQANLELVLASLQLKKLHKNMKGKQKDAFYYYFFLDN